MTIKKLIAFTTSAIALSSIHAATITFEENLLPSNSFFDPQENTSFSSGGVNFQHTWNDEFNCCWGNFTFSNSSDTTTNGFQNDRSAITGVGAAGSSNYGVSFGDNAFINFDETVTVSSVDITNTTFSFLTILNGNAFATQFGPEDFFRLTITGKDENNSDTGSVIFSLAEGTNIVDQWETVSLSSLGAVNSLVFSYDSSDVGGFGINTPTHFAIDNIEYQAVPLPAAAWLFLSGFACLRILRLRD